MLRIGIDIDDTLTNTSELLTEYAHKYDSDYTSDNYIINNVPKIVRGIFDEPLLVKFFTDHAQELGRNVTVKEGAKEVIDKLINDGHEIIFITARSDTYFTNAEEFNKEYLTKNNINYHKLICAKSYKTQICKEEKIDIMFDDAVDTCESMQKENIKGVVFTSQINKDRQTSCDRVSSWKELYDYINIFVKSQN